MNPYYRCFAAQRRLLRGRLPQHRPARSRSCEVLRRETIRRSPHRIVVPDDPAVLAAKRALTAAIEERIAAEHGRGVACAAGSAGVPCGPVLARETVHADEQVRANGLVQELEQPGLGSVTMLGPVFRLGERRIRPARGPPRSWAPIRRPCSRRSADEVRGLARAAAVRRVGAGLRSPDGRRRSNRSSVRGRTTATTRSPPVSTALGWGELWSDPALLGPAVVGGIELGRACAPVCLVDEADLGAPLCVGTRVRHLGPSGSVAAACAGGGLALGHVGEGWQRGGDARRDWERFATSR